MITLDRVLVPFPDVPGKVHGIVSLDPPKVQCDGCGLVATGDDLCFLILFCGINFNTRGDDRRRLCAECWGAK